MKYLRFLVAAIVVAASVMTSFSASAEISADSRAVISIIQTAADVIMEASPDKVESLSNKFKAELAPYYENTTELSSDDRKYLVSNLDHLVMTTVDKALSAQGISMSNPEVKAAVDTQYAPIREAIKKMAEDSKTLGEFLKAVENVN